MQDKTDQITQTKQHRKDLDAVLQRLKCDSDKGYTGMRAPDHPVRASSYRPASGTQGT